MFWRTPPLTSSLLSLLLSLWQSDGGVAGPTGPSTINYLFGYRKCRYKGNGVTKISLLQASHNQSTP